MNSKIVALVVVVMFAFAVGAGMVAGKLMSHASVVPATVRSGSLIDELQLNDEQRAKMQAIWEAAGKNSEYDIKQARQVQADLEIAVQDMLSDDQKAKYKMLHEQASAKEAALEKARHEAFKNAVDKTLPILNDAQRNIYRQIIRDRHLLPDETGARSGNVEAPLTSEESRVRINRPRAMDVSATYALNRN